MRPFDYKLIHALDVVIKEQNFEHAARALHITQSAVSQRIRQLEQQLAQPVLIRSSPLTLTATGQAVLRHFRQVRQLEFELAKEVNASGEHIISEVAIAVNADSLASWFIPAIAELLKKRSVALNLQVCGESRTQELVKRGEVYAALSSQEKSFSGCNVDYVGELDYILCASPVFNQQYFANGLTAKSLQKAPAVEFDHDDEMHGSYLQQHFAVAPRSYPFHIVRSSEAFVTMALADCAYCLIPLTQALPYLQQGLLVDLLPGKHLTQSLYWHRWVLEKGVHQEISQQVVRYGAALLSETRAEYQKLSAGD